MKTTYQFLVCILCVFVLVGCEGNSPSSLGGKKAEGVDLGLPSGILWAEHNLGANSPADNGAPFSWGDPRPIWNGLWNKNYSLSATDEDGRSYYTKYVTDLNYGKTIDNLVTLQPEDDPASIYWGGGWRTPSFDELLELFNSCEMTYEKINETQGVRLTGPNGNSIFLPATDYWTNSLYKYVGYYGSVSYFNDNASYFRVQIKSNAQSYYTDYTYGNKFRHFLSKIRPVKD